MRRSIQFTAILIYALLTHSANNAGSFAKLALQASSAQAGTVYPILDARFAYAAERHMGEARLGNVGAFPSSSQSEARVQPVCEGSGAANRCWLRFSYAFRDANPEEFAAAFFGLGRTGVAAVNPGCASTRDLDLHKDAPFDLTDLMQNAQDDKISIESLQLVVRHSGQSQTLTLRVELEDQNTKKRFRRVTLAPGAAPVTFTLPLANFTGDAEFDLKAVKVVVCVIEERHVADGVINPANGSFDLELIALVDENGPQLGVERIANLEGRALVSELARRDFETLLRVSDAKTGASLDRTLFRDLIQWGATGWLLAALPGAVQQGWISSEDARQRALRILRFVDNPALFGNEPVGKLGNSVGMMYRFGGIDPQDPAGPLTGTRKLDLGDCNSAEASVIDTALFQFGAATCAAGFASQSPLDQEINQRVRNILNRTRWNELVDIQTGQLQLGWKPEKDITPDSYFATPASFGGFWASHDAQGQRPLTIDYWTDEGGLAAILAAGSETASPGPRPWYAMLRSLGKGSGKDVVVSYPGAWFTYSFMTATYLDPNLGLDRAFVTGPRPVNWTKNAIDAFAAYQSASAPALPDAVELPDATYLAQGLPELAIDAGAIFTGTHTPWSWQLALGLGGETANRALAELQSYLRNRPELWDPMFGLLDGFHPNLAAYPPRAPMPRREGRWVQQQVWPLNKGGALLAQLNYLSDGVVWKTANLHPVIQRGLERIYKNLPLANVSAASFLGQQLAPESIVAAFGGNLATSIVTANETPLPTTLAGTMVHVRDSLGVERLAPLFFVGPTQVNLQLSPGTSTGQAMITVTSSDLTVSSGIVNVAPVAPGLFTANANGQGLAAAVALRIRTDNSLSYEPITRFDPALNRIVAVPIDLGPETDQVFLLLFGTGWRFRSSLAGVSLTVGGLNAEVSYAGVQGDFVGLDQLNVRLARTLVGRGEVDVALVVDGFAANAVRINVK